MCKTIYLIRTLAILKVAFAVGVLGGCGGGGDASPPVDPSSTQGGTIDPGSTGTQVASRYAAWWPSSGGNGLVRQLPSSSRPELVYITNGDGDSALDWLEEDFLPAAEGGDKAVTTAVPINANAGATSIHMLSAAEIIRQQAAGQTYHSTMKRVRGVLKSAALSHNGRYLAGSWAESGIAFVNQRWLGIVDLQAPEAQAVTTFYPPAGQSDKVTGVQWVGDDQMVVFHASGKKALWTVGKEDIWILLDKPAQFQGYTLESEYIAPDGMRYGGLMSKDGGKTHEVWTSNPDYTDMRQVTNAGVSLFNFKWMGSSQAIKISITKTSAGDVNRCNNAMFNPEGASMLSLQQLAGMPSPGNLPCDFFASIIK